MRGHRRCEIAESDFFPLLEKEGWPKAGVVISAGLPELTTPSAPAAQPPLLFKEGKFAAFNSFTAS
jgi:hypothetical protein